MSLVFLIKFIKLKYLLIIIVIISSIGIKKIINLLSPDISELTDLSKCPACYGTDGCAIILNGTLKFEFYDIFTTLSHLFAAKNVFYATLGKTRIVLKKLAQDNEFYLFDRMICDHKNLSHLCPDRKINKDLTEENYLSLIEEEISINNENNKLIFCPQTRHLKNILRNENHVNLWTLIKINPEPIILQIVRAEDGWPVAKYYGACGRLVAEKYAGLPLTIYYQEEWPRRAKIAIGLLELAQVFTFRDPEYSFYLTDLSIDNIVIDENDNPIIIDLENVIILHRNIPPEEQPQQWNSIHISDGIDCDNCFSFSPSDICNHHLSDHNYYSVCQLLSDKSGGLLHSIPSEILINHQELKIMINECVNPSTNSRIEAGDKLKIFLQQILEDLN